MRSRFKFNQKTWLLFVCCRFLFRFEVGLFNVAAVLRTDLDIYVVVVHRPPSNTAIRNEQLLSFLCNFFVGREVISVEDFNLPTLDWECENVAHEYVPPGQLMFLTHFVCWA